MSPKSAISVSVVFIMLKPRTNSSDGEEMVVFPGGGYRKTGRRMSCSSEPGRILAQWNTNIKYAKREEVMNIFCSFNFDL
jgi:hypothetical protein